MSSDAGCYRGPTCCIEVGAVPTITPPSDCLTFCRPSCSRLQHPPTKPEPRARFLGSPFLSNVALLAVASLRLPPQPSALNPSPGQSRRRLLGWSPHQAGTWITREESTGGEQDIPTHNYPVGVWTETSQSRTHERVTNDDVPVAGVRRATPNGRYGPRSPKQFTPPNQTQYSRQTPAPIASSISTDTQEGAGPKGQGTDGELYNAGQGTTTTFTPLQIIRSTWYIKYGGALTRARNSIQTSLPQ